MGGGGGAERGSGYLQQPAPGPLGYAVLLFAYRDKPYKICSGTSIAAPVRDLCTIIICYRDVLNFAKIWLQYNLVT